MEVLVRVTETETLLAKTAGEPKQVFFWQNASKDAKIGSSDSLDANETKETVFNG